MFTNSFPKFHHTNRSLRVYKEGLIILGLIEQMREVPVGANWFRLGPWLVLRCHHRVLQEFLHMPTRRGWEHMSWMLRSTYVQLVLFAFVDQIRSPTHTLRSLQWCNRHSLGVDSVGSIYSQLFGDIIACKVIKRQGSTISRGFGFVHHYPHC